MNLWVKIKLYSCNSKFKKKKINDLNWLVNFFDESNLFLTTTFFVNFKIIMTKDSNVHVIAQPLLDSDTSKKLYKAIGKAVKSKKVFYGSKTVNKMIRKGTKG